MKKIISGIFALILISSVSFAQKADDKEGHMSNKKKIMLADALMDAGSYYNAIDVYSEVYAADKDVDVASKLAHAYFLARDYKNAEKWYKTVIETAKDKYPDSEYYYAMSLKANAKYDQAKTSFKSFEKNTKVKGDNIPELKRDAKNQEKGCDLALLLIADPIKVNVDHLNANVNHNYTDFSPSYDPDNNLTYASLASDSVVELGSNKKIPENRIARIFEAKREGDNWGKGQVLNESFNKTSAHTGNGSYSPDGKRFYYTECNPNDQLKMICNIYMSELKNGDWGKGREVKEVNVADATSTHPAVGVFKGNEVLYFSSNRTGSVGGMDIWYSEISRNGEDYATPKNAGRKLNTTGDEITPFYSASDDMLYYSSNGLVTIGGLDIFKSKGGLKTWDNPENVGYPLNSAVDDFYYSLSKNGRKGFLVSNRPGGFSVKSETCCDDIYEIAYIIPPKFAIMGRVINSTTNTQVEGASVTLAKSGASVGQAISSASQQYYFFLGTQFDNYDLTAEREGYQRGKATTSTIGMVDDDTLYVDIYMEPIIPDKIVEVKNIFYTLGSAELRPESTRSLDSLYTILSNSPNIIVEFGSHTDYRNSDQANQILSQARAQSVVTYLVAKGIDSARMVPKGYGEKTPKTLSEDYTVPSGKVVPKGTVLTPKYIDTYKKNKDDYEALMQLNRRTEFKIIGEIPGTIVKYDQGQIDAENARIREEESKQDAAEIERKKKLMELQQVDDSGNVVPDNTNTNQNTNTNTNTKTDTKQEAKTDTKVAAAPGVDPLLTKKGNMYEGNAMLNGVEQTKYILNQNPSLTTAMMSKDMFIKLRNSGTVTDADFKNDKATDLGDGTTAKGDMFVIHSLQLGDAVYQNVECKINTSITQNIIVGVKVIENNGCSIDTKTLKLKCKK